MDMKTEDDQDEFREPLPEVAGEIEFENVWFEYNEGVPVLKNVSFHSPGRFDDGARRLQRLRQEHPDQSRDEF
jgi:ABC-type multidrug transport system fused ATPase/permease subunit